MGGAPRALPAMTRARAVNVVKRMIDKGGWGKGWTCTRRGERGSGGMLVKLTLKLLLIPPHTMGSAGQELAIHIIASAQACTRSHRGKHA